jgi:hypothetical protein
VEVSKEDHTSRAASEDHPAGRVVGKVDGSRTNLTDNSHHPPLTSHFFPFPINGSVTVSIKPFSNSTMPRVLSYTPSWLSRPSAGFDVFAAKDEVQANGYSKPSRPSKHSDFNVPSKTIACRGTEVFVAVGNEIRWSDLAWLKELEDDKAKGCEFTSEKQSYRV